MGILFVLPLTHHWTISSTTSSVRRKTLSPELAGDYPTWSRSGAGAGRTTHAAARRSCRARAPAAYCAGRSTRPRAAPDACSWRRAHLSSAADAGPGRGVHTGGSRRHARRSGAHAAARSAGPLASGSPRAFPSRCYRNADTQSGAARQRSHRWYSVVADDHGRVRLGTRLLSQNLRAGTRGTR
jgi:hypothetical protein